MEASEPQTYRGASLWGSSAAKASILEQGRNAHGRKHVLYYARFTHFIFKFTERSPTMVQKHLPVLIVGAGGAGLSLSLLLLQQGIPSLLIERRSDRKSTRLNSSHSQISYA